MINFDRKKKICRRKIASDDKNPVCGKAVHGIFVIAKDENSSLAIALAQTRNPFEQRGRDRRCCQQLRRVKRQVDQAPVPQDEPQRDFLGQYQRHHKVAVNRTAQIGHQNARKTCNQCGGEELPALLERAEGRTLSTKKTKAARKKFGVKKYRNMEKI